MSDDGESVDEVEERTGEEGESVDEDGTSVDVDDGDTSQYDEAWFEAALEAAAEALEAAETEADLDDVEAELEEIETALEEADLPEPSDEDDPDPAEEIESELGDIADDVEDARGPYASDVVAEIESAADEITGNEWTEKGEASLIDAVDAFLDDLNETLETDTDLSDEGEDVPTRLAASLDGAVETVEGADLDPDEDAETIESLLEATEELAGAIDDAQLWSDLPVRTQLERRGFYDVLDHIVDFPPELHALKVHEQQGNVDMILLAFDSFDSDFVEERCLDALERMGPEEAIEPMVDLARKRNKRAISILGKIGSEEPVDALLGYVDADTDPLLQRTTMRALGEIGSEEAVQPIANQLVAEDESVRSAAARALGMIGDTRAVDPLATTLEADESDIVRASAAWALNQIGTAEALEVVAGYTDDRDYMVQVEAEKAL